MRLQTVHSLSTLLSASLFSDIDADHGGTIDPAEMKAALALLRSQAKERQEQARAHEKAAARCHRRGKQIDEVHATTLLFEEAADNLHTMRVMLGYEEPKYQGGVIVGELGVRLYGSVMKKNMKIGELIKQWDKDKDGSIDLSEFVTNVKALVPSAEEQETQDLFASLDSGQKDGALDLEELNRMLRTLEQRATKAKSEESYVSVNVKELKKAALKAQAELLDALQKDEAEQAEREAANQAAEEEKARDREEAARAAKEKRASKAAAAKAEKAAFQARVSEKRRSSASETLGVLEA